MIDPTDVTKFDRTEAELQEWWLFSIIVAGKTASTQARLLNNFLTNLQVEHPAPTPFESIRLSDEATTLDWHLKFARLGQYTRLGKCIRESLNMDLSTASVADLETIHGIGPKTARMFVMHSRPSQRVAAIDTHVLKHLKANGHTVPKATPPAGKLYRKLEDAFLQLADSSGMTVADYDLAVWKSYATK